MRIRAKALNHLLVADHRPIHLEDRDLDHMCKGDKIDAWASRGHGQRWVGAAHLDTPQLGPMREGDVYTNLGKVRGLQYTMGRNIVPTSG